MSRKAVLATRNDAKGEELRRILREAQVDVTLLDARDFPDLPDVVESGLTFASNALLKARSAAAHTGLPAVADDSGLCVDALNGMPGVLSARWSGRHGQDDANLDLVLAQLAETSDEHRGAHFFCAAAVCMPPTPEGHPGTARVVEGMVDGTLLRERRGSGGFGYDPIFVPFGSALTTAQMSPADKDAISHRGQAFRALVPVIADILDRMER